jgi:EmrB/QacA subfamily drug resistance transporter
MGAVTTPDLPDPRRWRALSVCLLAGFVTLLDVSIVNVAVGPIQRGLAASAAELSWMVSGYTLAFGLVLAAAGRLGDDHGRRRMFLLALGLFTATSALAGLAGSGGFLVAMRLLQGVAAGLLNPQVIGVVQDLFRGRERDRALGLFSAVVAISTGVGPLLGGLLLQIGSPDSAWRAVFFVNVPIGLVGLVLGARLLPRDGARGRSRRPLDLVGAALLGAAVVGVMLPTALAEQPGVATPWWLLGVSAVLLVVLVRWERRARRTHGHPLLDGTLFRTRGYVVGTTVGALFFAGFTSIFFVLALYFADGAHYSPLAVGLAASPFALGSAGASISGGRLVTLAGRSVVLGGLVVVILGLVALDVVVRAAPADVGWACALPLLVTGIGSGLVIAPNQSLTLADVPAATSGVAAGMLQTGQRVGSAIGISAVGAVFFVSLAESRGDYPSSVGAGVTIAVGLVAAAAAVAAADLFAAPLAAARRGRAASTSPT